MKPHSRQEQHITSLDHNLNARSIPKRRDHSGVGPIHTAMASGDARLQHKQLAATQKKAMQGMLTGDSISRLGEQI